MKHIFALALVVCVGLECGCGSSAKQTNPQQTNPQYVPVPAITGQWTITFNGGPTVQVNLVSIPCSSISATAGDQPGVGNSDGATASSCSIANLVTPDSGGAAVGSITASGTDGYSPRTLLVSAMQDSDGTSMWLWFTECSENSAGECDGGWDFFFASSAILTASPTTFTGNWNCNSQGSGAPCSNQQGTDIATQE
jgi:hypothetical protein